MRKWQVLEGATIDHATLHRWLIKFSSLIDREVRARKKSVGNGYIKVKGRWISRYRAIGACGDTIEFLLRKRRDAAAAKVFFLGKPFGTMSCLRK